MGILVDASVLIGHERRRLDLRLGADGLEDEDIYLSAITASELLHGVHRAHDEAVRARRSAWVEGVLSRIPVLPIDLGTARTHGRLWADLVSRGEMIGAHDAWLAAAAVTHGLALATLNTREFERVPGLIVVRWD